MCVRVCACNIYFIETYITGRCNETGDRSVCPKKIKSAIEA